ncbi:claudin-34 [Archocentrus centrarchus]|uniref:claudin-34 n=1 Tax=Archocentrus centrarchus TaxID=63155 RepID=UPI0011E9FBCC|nr:claudin-34-like [Archocentrus centrarchus]
MIHLAHTAHWQFLGLIVGFLAWILTMTTVGLNEWRLWQVANVSVITSGEAWVGIWRVCFYSHDVPGMENCQSISISDIFAPVEIAVAQVLMMLAVIFGLAGNISGAVAVRMVYFSVEDCRNIRLVFLLAGVLYLLSATSSLVPLVWNMSSVLKNSTIDFPPEFQIPAPPVSQRIGSAIGVGLCTSIAMFVSGLLFLCYRYAWRAVSTEGPRDPLDGPWTLTTLPQKSELSNRVGNGIDNASFHRE